MKLASSLEGKLFSLSTRLGSLGIIDPVNSVMRSHNVSVHAIAILTEAIKDGFGFSCECRVECSPS